MTYRSHFGRNLLVGAALAVAGPTIGSPGSGGATLEAVPARSRVAPNPFAGDANAVKAGAKLYARYCAECHGVDALGGRGPALFSPRIRKPTPGDLFYVVTNGDLPAGMPSWSRLPKERRWQIVAFLKELDARTATTTPDASRRK